MGIGGKVCGWPATCAAPGQTCYDSVDGKPPLTCCGDSVCTQILGGKVCQYPDTCAAQARRAMTPSTESLRWHAAMVISVGRFLVARCALPIAGSDQALPSRAERVFYRTYARGAPPPCQQRAGMCCTGM